MPKTPIDLVRRSGTPAEGISAGLMAPVLLGITPTVIHILAITAIVLTIIGLKAMGRSPIAVGVGRLMSIVGGISSRRRRAATEALVTALSTVPRDIDRLAAVKRKGTNCAEILVPT